ncbi:F-box protein [Aspergillus stella-maris]|uniref:F-box protein n=1 Tax=Aspergillus stella-maris TaxID=1810926 RepID=UPI003CCE0C51
MNPSHNLGRHPSTHNIMFDVSTRLLPDRDGYHMDSYSSSYSYSYNNTSVLTKLIQLLRRKLCRSRTSLSKLPIHILTQIFDLLPLLDQACLALTCKSFHFIFNAVLEHEQFRFPRLYQLELLESPSGTPPLNLDLRPVSSLYIKEGSRHYARNAGLGKLGYTRHQLLLRLEDRRLKYCVKCMKLHHRESFAQPTYHGPMVYRDYCWSEAGVVDICPCISLTIRDKARIVQCLRRMKKGKGPSSMGGLENSFRTVEPRYSQVSSAGGEDGRGPLNIVLTRDVLKELRRPYLVHECSIDGHGLVAGNLKTVIFMQGGADNPMLVAETDYIVPLDKWLLYWQPTKGFKNALYNLLWAVRMSERGALLDDYDDFGRVRSQTAAENENGPEGQGQGIGQNQTTIRTKRVRVTRHLGRCYATVDEYWFKQDRMMSPSFLRLMHAYEN